MERIKTRRDRNGLWLQWKMLQWCLDQNWSFYSIYVLCLSFYPFLPFLAESTWDQIEKRMRTFHAFLSPSILPKLSSLSTFPTLPSLNCLSLSCLLFLLFLFFLLFPVGGTRMDFGCSSALTRTGPTALSTLSTFLPFNFFYSSTLSPRRGRHGLWLSDRCWSRNPNRTGLSTHTSSYWHSGWTHYTYATGTAC